MDFKRPRTLSKEFPNLIKRLIKYILMVNFISEYSICFGVSYGLVDMSGGERRIKKLSRTFDS